VRPEGLVFFVDRCLGAHVVPDALRAAGADVEVHKTHFEPNAPDSDILRFVGARRWVFLSKDRNIRWHPAEHKALVEAGVAAFILTAGRAKGVAIAGAFVAALDRIRRICGTHARPIIATVSLAGIVSVREGIRRGGIRRS
jgi:PIN domain-containing protein